MNESVCVREREKQKLLKVNLKKLTSICFIRLRLDSIVSSTSLMCNTCTCFNETCTFSLEVQDYSHYF